MRQWTNSQWKDCLRDLARTRSGNLNARIGGNNKSYPYQDVIVLVEDENSGQPQVQVLSADLLNSAAAVQQSVGDAGSSTAEKNLLLLEVGPDPVL